jgi:hypothetical protein
MKVTQQSSINEVIAQRQVQSGSIVNGFQSLLNQENDSIVEEKLSEENNTQLLHLQNKAYLNKAVLGIAV